MRLHLSICALAFSALAFGQAADTSFQISYATNLNAADAAFTFSNSGASSTIASPQNGTICVNIYTFSPDSTMLACCACTVKPNGLRALSARIDLLPRGSLGTSAVVKALASSNAPACNPATAGTGGNVLVAGMVAWATTLEGATTNSGAVFAPSRTPFAPATLSAAELTSLDSRCAALPGGICASCR